MAFWHLIRLVQKLSQWQEAICFIWWAFFFSQRCDMWSSAGINFRSNTILIYINDLFNVCQHAMPILFADDTNLFLSGHNLDMMDTIINQELKEISEWLKVNKLSLNIKKTHYMIFTTKRKRLVDVSLQIDGHIINETDSTKFLGVIIDNKLSWKNHIKHVVGKVSRGIGMILKARKLLNQDALITLYYSFIFPYFVYCNHVWGSTYESSWEKLHPLQKKIVRIIYRKGPRYHTDPLFNQWDWSNFMTSTLIKLEDSCIDAICVKFQNYSILTSGRFVIFIITKPDKKTVFIFHQWKPIWEKSAWNIEDLMSAICYCNSILIQILPKPHLSNHWKSVS